MTRADRAAGKSEVVLLISAGRGPVECAWAVGQLLSRLEAEAVRSQVTVTRLRAESGGVSAASRSVDTSRSVEAARSVDVYRSVLLRLSGAEAVRFARSWSGTLCWQAASPYRSGIGRKNWFVTAETQDAEPDPVIFAVGEVEFSPCRTGGPGGQHRDKASTAVRATHRPTGAVVVVDTERRLSDNRRLALDLLRQRVEQMNRDTARDTATARWRTHDALVRGAPTRIERP